MSTDDQDKSQASLVLADTLLDIFQKAALGDSVLLRKDEVVRLIALCRKVRGEYAAGARPSAQRPMPPEGPDR